ncbi:MAG: VWA domain-containing protein [Myxococcales bacterium]|nr:VWA domain-containing protein [Myxococcales bacterium]MCB9712323.1 VWA domain-containing protein [Myxococcales bacterium]
MSHFRLYPCLPLHRWIATTALLLPLACTDDGAPAEVMDTEGIELPTGGQSGDGLDESGTAADESGGLPGNCGAETFELQHEPTNVVLVLDKSYSMVDHSWDHDGDPGTEPVTRWNSLHGSVSFIVEEFDDGLNFGAVLFPAVDVPDNEWATACEVSPEPDAPVAPMGGEAVLAALPGPEAMDLYGGTPASGGITTALDHLDTLDDGLPQALILVTDGAANCMEGTTNNAVFTLYDEHLPELVAEAYGRGIPTFVVGIDIVDGIADYPQDNPYERLNEVAIAGGYPRPGTEKFHNAQDEEQLRAAISQVTSQIGCTIPLEMPPELPDLLSIVIDGQEIPWVDSCNGVDLGWSYVNPDGPYDEIELCGDACDSLHQVGTLSAHYNCIPQG